MQSDKSRNSFEVLSSVDVSKYVEEKNDYKYLSWAPAVGIVLKYYPNATWEHTMFKDPSGALTPYLETPAGVFVHTHVTIEGVTRSELHPVFDHRNKSITKPSAMDINKANKRSLVKVFGMHGLGLHIYAGEDLPLTEDAATKEARIELADLIATHEKDEKKRSALLSRARNASYDAARTGIDHYRSLGEKDEC